jgi:hypothetical protein
MKPIRKEFFHIRKELMTVEDLWTYLGLRHDDLWETRELHSPAFHIALSVIDTVRTMILNEEIK